MYFIDIHSHFLPGVDDGPKTLDDTIEMLRVAHAGGTRAMVATPHMFVEPFSNTDVDSIRECFAATIDGLERRKAEPGLEFLGEMEFFLGAENYVCSGFLEALAKRDVLSLNGSNYLLIEFPVHLPARQITLSVELVRNAGYVPVLAHVERYDAIRRAPDFLSEFLDAGCLTQVNADSFSGSFWSGSRRFAIGLSKRNLISIIASDGHGAHHRPPFLMETYFKLVSSLGDEQAANLFHRNPKWVVTRAKTEEHVRSVDPE